MILSITQQVRCITFSIMAGIITGVLFDLYRLIRGFNNVNEILTFVEDILFWIFSAIIVFVFLLIMDNVYMGIYVYMCMTIGIYLYIKLWSALFLNLHYKLIKYVMKIFRILRNIVVYPFMIIIYSIKRKNKENYKK